METSITLQRTLTGLGLGLLVALGVACDGDGGEGGDGSGIRAPGAAAALLGAWRPATGRTDLTCGDATLVQPAFGETLVEADANGTVQVTTSDGCALAYRVGGDGAQALPDQACDVVTARGPGRQTLSKGALRGLRDGEARLEAEGRVEGTWGACTFALRAALTRQGDALALAAPTVVASFAAGTFLESVANTAAGWLVVAQQGDATRLVRVDPSGAASTAADFPPKTLGTIAIDGRAVVHVTVGGLADPSVAAGVARLEGSTLVMEAELPAGASPNGIAVDASDTLYVADSALGRVWRLRPGATTPEIWAEGGPLAFDPALGFPGPNGIKVAGGQVYVSNPSKLHVVRIPLRPDGSAGDPSILVDGIGVDDFAVDPAGNLYATTHPLNSLVLVRGDGTARVLLGADEGMWGPTAAVLGAAPGGGQALYVVTDGNVFGAQLPPPLRRSDATFEAQLLRVELGDLPGVLTVPVGDAAARRTALAQLLARRPPSTP
jgi:hypothetical protein